MEENAFSFFNNIVKQTYLLNSNKSKTWPNENTPIDMSNHGVVGSTPCPWMCFNESLKIVFKDLKRKQDIIIHFYLQSFAIIPKKI